MKRLVAVLLLLVVAGCGNKIQTVRLIEIQDAVRRAPEKVEVFIRDRPDRPYRKIGVLKIDSDDIESVTKKFRKEAAKMGGDAIILEHRFKPQGSSAFIMREAEAEVIQWK